MILMLKNLEGKHWLDFFLAFGGLFSITILGLTLHVDVSGAISMLVVGFITGKVASDAYFKTKAIEVASKDPNCNTTDFLREMKATKDDGSKIVITKKKRLEEKTPDELIDTHKL